MSKCAKKSGKNFYSHSYSLNQIVVFITQQRKPRKWQTQKWQKYYVDFVWMVHYSQMCTKVQKYSSSHKIFPIMNYKCPKYVMHAFQVRFILLKSFMNCKDILDVLWRNHKKKITCKNKEEIAYYENSG